MNDRHALQAVLEFGDLAAKSALVLLAAWLLTVAMRRASAAIRHMVWFSAFFLLLAIPVLTAFVPSRRLALFREAATVRPSLDDSPIVSAELPTPARLHGKVAKTSPKAPSVDLGPVLPLRSLAPGSSTHAANSDRHVAVDWAVVSAAAIAIWLLGALAVSAHALWGLRSLRRLSAKTVSLETGLACPVDLHRLSGRIGIRRKWNLRLSERSEPPAAMTWGLFRPVVLLPKNSDSWSQERVEAVLLHELAHVRRLDCVSQFIAVLASALYWFNPAVWLCARAMRAEAEAAADDTVIRLGVRPSDYARELLAIAAELGHRRQPFTTIGVPVMKKSKIESRVKAILDPSARRRRGVTLMEALAAVCIVAAVAIPLSSVRAAIVPSDPPTRGILVSMPQVQVPGKLDDWKNYPAKAEAVSFAEMMKRKPTVKRQTEAEKMAAEVKALRAQLNQAKSQLASAQKQIAGEKALLEELKRSLHNNAGTDKSGRNALQADENLLMAELQRMRAEMAREKQSMDMQSARAAKELQAAQMQAIRAQEDAVRAQQVDRKVQVINAEKQLEIAKLEVDNAVRLYSAMEKQFNAGLVQAQELDEKRNAIRVAQARLNAAEATLKTIKGK